MHRDIKNAFDSETRSANPANNAPPATPWPTPPSPPKTPRDRFGLLLDKFIQDEISEETFNNILAAMKPRPNYKNDSGMYV